MTYPSNDSIVAMTDQELEVLALDLGGTELYDQINSEATLTAEAYMHTDGTTEEERDAVYKTVWRLRVVDAVQVKARKESDGMGG